MDAPEPLMDRWRIGDGVDKSTESTTHHDNGMR